MQKQTPSPASVAKKHEVDTRGTRSTSCGRNASQGHGGVLFSFRNRKGRFRGRVFFSVLLTPRRGLPASVFIRPGGSQGGPSSSKGKHRSSESGLASRRGGRSGSGTQAGQGRRNQRSDSLGSGEQSESHVGAAGPGGRTEEQVQEYRHSRCPGRLGARRTHRTAPRDAPAGFSGQDPGKAEGSSRLLRGARGLDGAPSDAPETPCSLV